MEKRSCLTTSFSKNGLRKKCFDAMQGPLTSDLLHPTRVPSSFFSIQPSPHPFIPSRPPASILPAPPALCNFGEPISLGLLWQMVQGLCSTGVPSAPCAMPYAPCSFRIWCSKIAVKLMTLRPLSESLLILKSRKNKDHQESDSQKNLNLRG